MGSCYSHALLRVHKSFAHMLIVPLSIQTTVCILTCKKKKKGLQKNCVLIKKTSIRKQNE